MSEFREVLDPAIEALINKLPAGGEAWPTVARRQWLRAMEAVFDVVYSENEPLVTVEIKLIDEPTVEADPEPPKVEEPLPVADTVEVATMQIPQTSDAAPRSRPGMPRPSGIPSTFEMFRTVLTDKPSLTARELIEEVERRWWPGCTFKQLGPEISTFVTEKRLWRDPDGRLDLTDKGRNLPARAPIERAHRKPPEPKPVPPAPAPVPEKKRLFVYGSKPVDLTLAEFAVAEALRGAVGKGFLDYQHLGLRARGTSPSRIAISDKAWLATFMPALIDKLAFVGLEVVHRENYGYEMKRV